MVYTDEMMDYARNMLTMCNVAMLDANNSILTYEYVAGVLRAIFQSTTTGPKLYKRINEMTSLKYQHLKSKISPFHVDRTKRYFGNFDEIMVYSEQDFISFVTRSLYPNKAPPPVQPPPLVLGSASHTPQPQHSPCSTATNTTVTTYASSPHDILFDELDMEDLLLWPQEENSKRV